MTVIKGSTKRGQQLLARANHFEGTDLSDVYGRYSSAKASALRDCRRWCEETNGYDFRYDFRIVSHNTFGFSVAWRYNNPETGEVMTRIETSSGTYIIDGSRPNYEFTYYLNRWQKVPDPATIDPGKSICRYDEDSGYMLAIVANGEPDWDKDENLIVRGWYDAYYCNPDGASQYCEKVEVEGMTKAELERFCKKEMKLFATVREGWKEEE